jgi:acid phosphatase type 7
MMQHDFRKKLTIDIFKIGMGILFFYCCMMMSVSALDPMAVTQTFGKDPTTQMNLSWHSDLSEDTCYLEYSEIAKDQLFKKPMKVKATSVKSKNDQDERMVHQVALSMLKADTKYMYRMIYKKDVSKSGVFQTAKKEATSFRFINISDTQGVTRKDYKVWGNTLTKALSKFPDTNFLIHSGDVVDNGDQVLQWDYFVEEAKHPLAFLPIMPVMGNHDDVNRNGSNLNSKNFTERFLIQQEDDTGADEGTVYSFDYGPAHFVFMNTQGSQDDLVKQGEWLKQDVLASNQKWKNCSTPSRPLWRAS